MSAAGHGMMSRVILSRLAYSVAVTLVLSIIIFAFMRAVPGDPVMTLLADSMATKEQYEAVRHSLGLDLPYYRQYLDWMGLVLQGNFGTSIVTNQPVLGIVVDKLKNTMQLAVLAVLFGTVVGIAVGALSAVKRDSALSATTMIGCLVGVSIPVFWLGIILIIIFSVELNLLPTDSMMSFDTIIPPVTGFALIDAVIAGDHRAFLDLLAHFVLPTVTLGLTPAALIARTTRAAVLEVINEDYVKAGLARGLSFAQVLRRHVLRNSMIPVVTIIGLEIGVFLGGSIVTETIFSWPGLGREMLAAINAHDFPVVQGAVLIYALVIVAVNLLVDLSYRLLDPRVAL